MSTCFGPRISVPLPSCRTPNRSCTELPPDHQGFQRSLWNPAVSGLHQFLSRSWIGPCPPLGPQTSGALPPELAGGWRPRPGFLSAPTPVDIITQPESGHHMGLSVTCEDVQS